MPSCKKCQYPIDTTLVLLNECTYHRQCAEELIRPEIDTFIQALLLEEKKKEKIYWKTIFLLLVIASGVVVFIYIGSKSVGDLLSIPFIIFFIGGIFFFFVFAYLHNFIILKPIFKRGASLYAVKFPLSTGAREIADKILFAAASPAPDFDFIKGFRASIGIVEPNTTRIEKSEKTLTLPEMLTGVFIFSPLCFLFGRGLINGSIDMFNTSSSQFTSSAGEEFYKIMAFGLLLVGGALILFAIFSIPFSITLYYKGLKVKKSKSL